MDSASFPQRALGRTIDMFVIFVLSAAALAPFTDRTSGTGEVDQNAPLWFVALVIVAIFAYEVVPVHLRGQTPGKVVAHTKVVTGNGGLPTIKQSLLRWVIVVAILVFGSPFGILALVAIAALYLTALADPNGRSVLDKLAGTRVVTTRQPADRDEVKRRG
jgi:uncharacterized RDD family membrane protein YckC